MYGWQGEVGTEAEVSVEEVESTQDPPEDERKPELMEETESHGVRSSSGGGGRGAGGDERDMAGAWT